MNANDTRTTTYRMIDLSIYRFIHSFLCLSGLPVVSCTRSWYRTLEYGTMGQKYRVQD